MKAPAIQIFLLLCCAQLSYAVAFLLENGIYTQIEGLGSARGINDAGAIVGTTNYPDRLPALRDANGTITIIRPTPSDYIQLYDINNAGQIAGTMSTSGLPAPFLYSEGVFNALDIPWSEGTPFVGMNDIGQIVGTMPRLSSGFLYEDGATTILRVPGSTSYNLANAVNDLGQVVGFFDLPNGHSASFLYWNGVFTTFSFRL